MKKGGFSLVEILIVLMIFGTLASIILVSIGKKAREKAHDAVEIAQLEQLDRALTTFLFDRGHLPWDTTKTPITCDWENNLSSCMSTQACGDWGYGGETTCVECSSSDPSTFIVQLQNDGYLPLDAVERMFGNGGVDDPELNMCYFFTEDLQRFKLVAFLYNDSVEASDGGVASDFYELGNDQSLPFWDTYMTGMYH